MKLSYLILYFFLVLSIGCDNSKNVTEYYESGKIKREFKTVDGVKKGEEVVYYNNGTIKSQGLWADNKRNGELIGYYENGQLFTKTYWIDNKQEGWQIKYNKDGSIYSKGFYKDNKRKEVRIFNNEKLSEKQLYDGNENLIYVAFINSEGDKIQEFVPIIFLNDKDTISLGNKHTIKMKVGLDLKGQLKMYSGKLNDVMSLIDTVKLFKNNGIYEYTIKPNKVGRLTIPFIYEYQSTENDTININGMLTKHELYVKNSLLKI